MITNEDIDTLARTIYGEARGEYIKNGLATLIAVANVIKNRWQHEGKYYGSTIKDVCLKPWQFSCWNEDDKNKNIIKSVTQQNNIFKICKTVSHSVLKGNWPDLTNGANHYYSDTLRHQPYWAKELHPTVKLGRHIFFKI